MISAIHKDYYDKIAYNLFRIRTENGLTQEQLSYNANVERSKISRIENAVEDFIFSTILKLATALTVDVKDLLDFSVTIPPEFRERNLKPKNSI